MPNLLIYLKQSGEREKKKPHYFTSQMSPIARVGPEQIRELETQPGSPALVEGTHEPEPSPTPARVCIRRMPHLGEKPPLHSDMGCRASQAASSPLCQMSASHPPLEDRVKLRHRGLCGLVECQDGAQGWSYRAWNCALAHCHLLSAAWPQVNSCCRVRKARPVTTTEPQIKICFLLASNIAFLVIPFAIHIKLCNTHS